MPRARLLVCILTVTLAVGFASADAQQFQLRGSWWQGPAQQTRRTTLVASLDSATSNDADYARGDPRSGGFGMAPDVAGKHGRATRIAPNECGEFIPQSCIGLAY